MTDISQTVGAGGAPAATHMPTASAEGLSAADMDGFRTRILGDGDKNLNDDIQAELAAVMAVAARIEESNLKIPDVAKQIDFIIDCLLMPTSRIALAREERLRLQIAIYPWWWRPFANLGAGNSIGVVFIAPIISLTLFAMIL